MASGPFSLTAEVNIRLNSGSLRSVQTQIQSGLSGLNVPVGVTVSPSAGPALSGLQRDLGNVTTAAAQATQSARAFSQASRELGDTAYAVGQKARASSEWFAGWSLAIGGVRASLSALRSSLSEAVAFETQMRRLGQVGVTTQAQVRGVADEIGRLSTAWGISSRDLSQVAVAFRQAGQSAEQVKQSLEGVSKASLLPGFGTIPQTAERAISLFKQWGVAGADLEKSFGAVNVVSRQFGVSADEVLRGVERSGQAFKNAGGSLTELTALVGALRSKTSESADSISAGLRTIFTRMEQPAVLEHLQQLGVRLRNLNGEFVGPLEAVKRLGEALGGLRSTDPRVASISSELGGGVPSGQASRVLTLLQEQRNIQAAVNTAQAGSIGVTEEAAKAQGTLAVGLAQTREEWLKLGRSILADQGVRALAQDALKLASAFATIADTLRPLLPLLVTLTTVKLAQNVTGFARGFMSGPPRRFHSGGPVQGYGELPALLEGGEYVIRRGAAQTLGRPTLDRLNFADGGQVPGLLSLQRDPRMRTPEDVRLLSLTPSYQGAARRYVNQRVAYLESDRPPVLAPNQRATIEGILFERYLQKHLTGFNPGAGLDFPNLSEQDREALGRLTGADVSGLSGVELKRTADRRRLYETRRKAGYAEGGHVDARVMPGEFIFDPEAASRIGVGRLRRMNDHAQFASGGLVPGVGSTDSVPMMLPAGAFVIRKRAVERLGVDNLHRMAQRYSGGGLVHFDQGGEAHPFGNFPQADFGGFVASVKAEAERLKVALSSTTQVFVDFTEAGPVFKGFVEQAKAAQAGVSSFQQMLAESREYQRGLAQDLVGTRAGRESLVAKGFLSPEVAAQIAAGPEGVLTTRQQDTRTRDAAREERIRAMAERAARGVGVLDPSVVVPDEEEFRGLLSRRRQQQAAAPHRAPAGPPGVPPGRPPAPPVPPPPPEEPDPTRGPRLGFRRNFASEEASRRAAALQEWFGAHPLPLTQTGLGVPPTLYEVQNERVAQARAERLAREETRRRRGAIPFAPQQSLRGIETVPLAGEGGIPLQTPLTYGVLPEGYRPTADLYDVLPPDTVPFARGRRRVRRAARPADVYGIDREVDSQDIFDLLPVGDRNEMTNARLRRRPRYGRVEEWEGYGSRAIRTTQEEQEGLRRLREEMAREPLEPPGGPSRWSRLRGFVGGAYGRARGGLSALGGRIGAANRYLEGTRLGRAISGPGAYVLATATSYGSDFLNREAGTAEDAARTGHAGSYEGFRAAGGALQGGLLGATIGASVGGPIGAAVGGVAGALYGLVSSLHDAERDIRQAKLGNSLNEFSTKLNALTSPDQGTALAAVGGSRQALDLAQRQIDEKAADEATHRWRSVYTLGLGGGFNTEEYSTARQREMRSSFGQQLPQVVAVLNRQAEELGRSRLVASVNDLTRQLEAGNGGLNRELLKLIASLRGVSEDAALRDFTKVIIDSQRSARLQQDRQNVEGQQERAVNAFGRLVQAVEVASASLFDLQARTHTLTDAFQGRVGASPVGGISDILSLPGNPNLGQYQQSLGATTAPFGPAGGRLFDAGQAVNRLESVLPLVLARVTSGNPLDADDFAGRTRQLVREGLGYGPNAVLPEQLSRGLESVLTQLRGMKLPDIERQTASDVGGLTRKLTETFSAPIRDSSVRIAKALEGEANRFIGELTQAAQRAATIREAQNRLEQVNLQGVRVRAQFQAEAEGRRHEALDYVSLSQLQRPFQARQEALVGVAGPTATDPRYINSLLGNVRRQLAEATTRQGEVFRTTGGVGPQFEQAAANLVRLQDASARLQEALRHLSDASERSAGAQEKLAKIQQDRESRLAFGERYIMAGSEERLQMQRGLLLANAANTRGSLRGFANEDQRLILQTLQSLGNTKLSGFAGQPNAADLRTNLVQQYMGLAAQDPANRQAEADLKKTISDNYQAAGQAQQAFLTNLGQLHQETNNALRQSQAEFLARLGDLLARDRIIDRQNEMGEKGRDVQRLQVLAQQRNVLSRFGVTTDEQVAALNKPENRQLFQQLAAQRGQVEEFIKQRRSQTEEAITGLSRDTSPTAGSPFVEVKTNALTSALLAARMTTQFGTALGRLNIDQTGAEQVREQFRQVAARRLESAGIHTPGFWAGQQEHDRFRNDPRVQSILQQSLREAITAQTSKDIGTRQADAVKTAQQIRALGLNPNIITPQNQGQFFQALDAFSKGEKLAGLDAKLGETTAQFERLRQTVEALNGQFAGARPPGHGMASGGQVLTHPGRPQGTDTVPAWLTPGEYVVNAASARANRELLEQMNKGRRVYTQTDPMGGTVPLSNPIGSGVDGRGLGGVHYHALGGTVDDQLQRQALTNPSGVSAQILLARQWQQYAAMRERGWAGRYGERTLDRYRLRLALLARQSLAQHYYAGQSLSLRRRQRLAHFTDPGAAFGLGHPGIEAQVGMAGHVLPGPTQERNPWWGAQWELDLGRRLNVRPQSLPFAEGGLVPGSFTGGVDDVPARLTRGEYVLRPEAVRTIGVAALDHANRFATGGLVPGGGTAPGGFGPLALSPESLTALSAFNGKSEVLAGALTAFAGQTQALQAAFNQFGDHAKTLANALSQFPSKVQFDGQWHGELILNGASVLANLEPSLRAMVQDQMDATISKLLKERFPDA